jgi:hypothetical protein
MQMPEELMMQSNAFFEHYVKSPMDHFFRPGCERISNLNELIALEMLQSRPACISEFSNLMGMYGNPGISFMQFEMARIASAARLNSYAFFPHF